MIRCLFRALLRLPESARPVRPLRFARAARLRHHVLQPAGRLRRRQRHRRQAEGVPRAAERRQGEVRQVRVWELSISLAHKCIEKYLK